MIGFKLMAIAAFAVISAPSVAQMENGAMNSSMSTTTQTSGDAMHKGSSSMMMHHGMSGRHMSHGMKMSMKSCHRMSHRRMMQNRQCRMMMHHHHAMMMHHKM